MWDYTGISIHDTKSVHAKLHKNKRAVLLLLFLGALDGHLKVTVRTNTLNFLEIVVLKEDFLLLKIHYHYLDTKFLWILVSIW